MNGSFIEGQTQTIDLDDEDPSIFKTYVAWLYQGQLNSQDIEEALDDPHDFDLHIAELIVFADKRDIGELKNDAISMFLNYLQRIAKPATIEAISCIYNMPKSAKICNLREMLAIDETWFNYRLKNRIDHWHPEFLASIIKAYNTGQAQPYRVLNDFLFDAEDVCRSVHKHAVKTHRCSSLTKNMYTPAAPPDQQPSNKKRRIMPSSQTVELLDD